MEIIKSKEYNHFNRSLNKHISSKRQYEDEMKRQGMIPKEQADRIAEKARKEQQKPYILSEKAKAIINSAKMSADKKGNVKLGDRAIKAMEELGVNFNPRFKPGE